MGCPLHVWSVTCQSHGLLCVIMGHDAVCVLLLPLLDVQNIHGWTAAMNGARNGHMDILTALIDNKADLDIQVRRRKWEGNS